MIANTDMYAFAGTGVFGTWLAQIPVTHSRKPRVAPFAQSMVDNSIRVSARWHRRT